MRKTDLKGSIWDPQEKYLKQTKGFEKKKLFFLKSLYLRFIALGSRIGVYFFTK